MFVKKIKNVIIFKIWKKTQLKPQHNLISSKRNKNEIKEIINNFN